MQVEFMELSPSYMNTLAQQFINIAAFLGGFSATILGTLIVSDNRTRFARIMVVASSMAAMCFVVTIFGMAGVLFQTAEGYPLEVNSSDLMITRTVGVVSFFLGLLSFIVTIASSGWLISKGIGRFTSVLGIIAFVLIFMMA